MKWNVDRFLNFGMDVAQSYGDDGEIVFSQHNYMSTLLLDNITVTRGPGRTQDTLLIAGEVVSPISAGSG